MEPNIEDLNEEMPTQEEMALAEQDMVDQQDSMDEQTEAQEDMDIFNEMGDREKAENLYKLFNDIRTSDDTTRTSNLQLSELGNPLVSMRDCELLAQLGELHGHHGWAKFWRSLGQSTSNSAMSKKGWFSELLVSNKRYTNKTTNAGFNPSTTMGVKKGNKIGDFFKGKSKTTEGGEFNG